MRPVRLLLVLAIASAAAAAQARLADLVDVSGVRDNYLRGVSLVYGLNGTGDGSAMARQLAANLLKRKGNNFPPGAIAPDNIAVVMVTATLPPFTKPGSKIDVTVASIGDAKSLRGGQLLEAQLTGPDETTVYALAQGAVLVGGVTASGNSGSKETINHPTVGRIPNGAIVELDVPQRLVTQDGRIVLHLREPSAETSQALAETVNKVHPGLAMAKDYVSVELRLPAEARKNPVEFLAKLSDLRIKVAPKAKVVISERNGTIVAGGDVVLMPVSITHANLSISVKENYDVSQPNPLSERGQTVVTPRSDVSIEQTGTEMRYVPGSVGAGELAAALKALGVAPGDLITIFQMLKAQGALQAELVIL